MNIRLAASLLFATGWLQFGHDPAHTGAVAVNAQRMQTVIASVVMDPFVVQEEMYYGDDLLVHYAAPLMDGDDVFVEIKGGAFTAGNWSTQTWGVQALRWDGNKLTPRWTAFSDWKPAPNGAGGPAFEPVFQPVLANGFVYLPAAGGGVLRVNRDDGTAQRFGPAAVPPDRIAYVSGPLVADAAGNVMYNVLVLDAVNNPWNSDTKNAWIVRIGTDGTAKTADYASIVTGAPLASDFCLTSFSDADIPWPPSPNAMPPAAPCGSQRPGVNIAPAIASDGTIYTVSRAHFNSRWAYLVALNSDLTPKWTRSLRDRFHDGCNVILPPNGSPGGCRDGALTGVDPSDNTMGSGRVIDDSSSSPLVAPDGSVLYGAYSRYNFTQGHLIHFSAAGDYLGAYPFGWDETPGVFGSGNGYTVITKENHYPVGTYCDDPIFCPVTRNEAYFVTALDPQLHVRWSARAPRGFEWCINGPAIDGAGITFVNSEDGYLYSINSDGTLRQQIQLTSALGQAYTPVAIDDHGRIYAEKSGMLFVVGARRSRAVR